MTKYTESVCVPRSPTVVFLFLPLFPLIAVLLCLLLFFYFFLHSCFCLSVFLTVLNSFVPSELSSLFYYSVFLQKTVASRAKAKSSLDRHARHTIVFTSFQSRLPPTPLKV